MKTKQKRKDDTWKVLKNRSSSKPEKLQLFWFGMILMAIAIIGILTIIYRDLGNIIGVTLGVALSLGWRMMELDNENKRFSFISYISGF